MPPSLTKDGYELQFGTNHLGHALLIKKLLPTILHTISEHKSDARIVILTSLGFRGHPSGGIRFDTLKTVQDFGMGGPWVRYGQSKLANVFYARELARRYPEITALSVHPGVVGTTMVSGMGPANKLLVYLTNPGGLLTPEEGAYNQLWAAFGNKQNIENGKAYEPMGKPIKLGKTSSDEELAKKLWEWTEEALKEW
jgi:NAD(P)-dependent dehydrogenase (short-subunit alcohol dehydrogenase family)